jgi:hypothetical protein
LLITKDEVEIRGKRMKGKPQRHDDHFIDFSIVLKLYVKSPSLSPPIPSAFTPYPPLSAK